MPPGGHPNKTKLKEKFVKNLGNSPYREYKYKIKHFYFVRNSDLI